MSRNIKQSLLIKHTHNLLLLKITPLEKKLGDVRKMAD